MTSKGWREWIAGLPVAEMESIVSPLEECIDDLAEVEKSEKEMTDAAVVAINRAERAEKDRDEWKGMASRGATTNVEYMALMEAAQDRAERAESTLSRLRECAQEALDWMVNHREHESKEYTCTCGRCCQMDGTIQELRAALLPFGGKEVP